MPFSSRVLVVTSPNEVPSVPIDNKPTLVYWNICGLAQAIRMALALGGADFNDVRIDAGKPGSSDYKQVWFQAKPELADVLPFPNLPYYLDSDNVALTQSNAILKYVGRKYGLIGAKENQEHVVDMCLGQLVDLDAALVKLSYGSKSMEDIRVWATTKAPLLLQPWERVLGSRPYLTTGEKLTVADLKLYEVLRKIDIIEVELCGKEEAQDEAVGATIGGSEVLAAFAKRMENVPRIKAYRDTDSFLYRPLNNPHAMFS